MSFGDFIWRVLSVFGFCLLVFWVFFPFILIRDFDEIENGVITEEKLILDRYASRAGSDIIFTENAFEEKVDGQKKIGMWAQYDDQIELISEDGKRRNFCIFFNSERLIEVTEKCKCIMETLGIEGCMKNSLYRISALPALSPAE